MIFFPVTVRVLETLVYASVSLFLGAEQLLEAVYKSSLGLPFRRANRAAKPLETMSTQSCGPVPEPCRSESARWIPSWQREAIEDLQSRRDDVTERTKVYSRLFEEYLSLKDALVAKRRSLKILKQDLKFRNRLNGILKEFLREELGSNSQEKEEEEEVEGVPAM